MNEKFVFRIFDREKGTIQSAYSRSYQNEFDFDSVSDARNSNCHDIFQDKKKYRIAKYKVTFELIEEDCNEN